MPDLLRFELRRRWRTTGARVGLLVAALALGVACVLPTSGAGVGSVVEAASLVVVIAAGVAAASAASSAPEDRATLVAPWLRATGVASARRRTAPALAAALLALGTGLAGGLLVGGLCVATGLASPRVRVAPLPLEGATRLVAAAGERAADRAVVRSGAAGATFELEVRPVFRSVHAAGRGTTRLALTSDGVRREETVAVRGVLAFPTGGDVVVEALEREIDLRVVAVRRREGFASFPVQAALLGLLLGAAVGCGAPTAAFVARATSTPTAATFTAMLLLLGAAREPVREVAAGLADAPVGVLGAGLLRGATALAPDLSALVAASEVAAGRALRLASFEALLPALAHAGVALLLLAFVPGRSGATGGT